MYIAVFNLKKGHRAILKQLFFILSLIAGSLKLEAYAWTDVALNHVIGNASKASGVPKDLLYAIMKVESSVWPWTIHHDGQAYYFDTQRETVEFIENAEREGLQGLNIGLMQIYWPTHKSKIRSIEEIVDPEKNLLFAAKILSNLKKELGSWEKAVKAYHSRIPVHGNRYKKRVEAHLGKPLTSI